ncbi:MAG: hypothetical protein AAF462_05945 [Thermodesulfobacteriota bacterium]
MKKYLLLITFALILACPYASLGQTMDKIVEQFIPEDVQERPLEVPNQDDFERDTFNRENFYNKSAGTRQYRRTMLAPTKSMDFEVINPLEQPTEEQQVNTNAQIVEKDGKAITVISIDKDSETTN